MHSIARWPENRFIIYFQKSLDCICICSLLSISRCAEWVNKICTPTFKITRQSAKPTAILNSIGMAFEKSQQQSKKTCVRCRSPINVNVQKNFELTILDHTSYLVLMNWNSYSRKSKVMDEFEHVRPATLPSHVSSDLISRHETVIKVVLRLLPSHRKPTPDTHNRISHTWLTLTVYCSRLAWCLYSTARTTAYAFAYSPSWSLYTSREFPIHWNSLH